MSNAPLPRPPASSAARTFALVAGRFNSHYVDGLVAHAQEELRALLPQAALSLHHVPGAFEIPVLVREIALHEKADAILAFGVILQGSTTHAEHLSHSVTHALQQIAITHGVPVINAVLGLQNETQARERCLEKKINRGIEAARAAVEISDVMASLRAHSK